MITRPISKSIGRGIALAINDPSGAGFNPLSLFAAGEQGVWYDPSDLSTMFQDAMGTIPVTAAGQPVGMVRDKSGNGNHATQDTATARPILQTEGGKWYLEFDGVDDWLQTGTVNFTAADKMTTWAGLMMLASAAAGMVVELSLNSASPATYPGIFAIFAPYSSNNYAMRSCGTSVMDAVATGFIAPKTSVLCGVADIPGDLVSLRVNGAKLASSSGDQGTGQYGNWPMFIGRRGDGSRPFSGNLYSVVIRGAASSDQQITDAESYVNSKTGAY